MICIHRAFVLAPEIGRSVLRHGIYFTGGLGSVRRWWTLRVASDLEISSLVGTWVGYQGWYGLGWAMDLGTYKVRKASRDVLGQARTMEVIIQDLLLFSSSSSQTRDRLALGTDMACCAWQQ